MLEKLVQAQSQGKLIHLDPQTPTFVDLARALGHLAGVPDLHLSANTTALAKQIEPAEHLVFLWLDGLGTHMLETLPPDAFLRRQLKTQLNAVFPSTTACATAAMATGHYPATHGVPGWWAYLDEHRLSVTPLPFVERYSNTLLHQHEVEPQSLWPLATLMGQMTHQVLAIAPESFWDSVFTRYMRDNRPGAGYKYFPQSLTLAQEHIDRADGPTYTYIYCPEPDSTSHDFGWDSRQIRRVLKNLNRHLEGFAAKLKDNTRLIISADHGHTNVGVAQRRTLYFDDPLLDLLKAPPTGDARVPVFHLRPGREEDFVDQFEHRFGDQFALLSRPELEELRLLGPEPLSQLAQRRFGDFVGIATEAATLKYYPPKNKPQDDHLGHHAGLSSLEMEIPLIVV